MDLELEKNHFENLVFEGGGTRGVAFVGCIQVLEELDILTNIKGVIGSSAGSITATALAVGYKSYELKDVLQTTDFTQFQDDSFGLLRDFWRILKKYGFYKGDKYMDWIGSIIAKKTGNSNTTFKEIYEMFGKELVITGTNLDQGKLVYFNYIDYPNMPVKLAARISSSIPLVFQAVKYENDHYVDGGVLNNYPIWYFQPSNKTLGFKLVKNNEKRDDLIIHKNQDINNIKDYGISLVEAMLSQIERSYVRNDYWERTVTVNTFEVSAIDFNIGEETQNKLINEGYQSTKLFINKFQKSFQHSEIIITDTEPTKAIAGAESLDLTNNIAETIAEVESAIAEVDKAIADTESLDSAKAEAGKAIADTESLDSAKAKAGKAIADTESLDSAKAEADTESLDSAKAEAGKAIADTGPAKAEAGKAEADAGPAKAEGLNESKDTINVEIIDSNSDVETEELEELEKLD